MNAADARVLLTGASGGIGQAAAQALQQAGARIMGVGRSAAPAPGGMAWVRADLTTPAGLSAVTEAAADWGANVLVHAAGAPCFGPLGAVPPTQLQAVLQSNLLVPLLLRQRLLPHLLR